MRYLPLCLLLLLIVAGGYGYLHNPIGCAKLGSDLVAVFTETSSIPDATTVVPSASPNPTAPSTTTVTVSPATAPAPTASAPPTNAPPVAAVPTPAPASPPPTATAASPNASADAPAPFKPFKRWTPPAVLPAQPNWTWTTSDDKTYQNVVINKIESTTVSITHSLGATHLDISTLPADIQKQLNYDPETAAAAKVEARREADHPFYPMTKISEAEAVARQMNWPIAWLFSGPEALTAQNSGPETWEGMTQMALKTLQTQTIVIYEKGNEELPLVPAAVITELFHLDDGPIEGGHHYYPPKIVFSNADATKTFGRVAYTQIKASGQAAIDAALANIQDDHSNQASPSAQPAGANLLPPAADAK